jgi:DME family drug/metabolite transporter
MIGVILALLSSITWSIGIILTRQKSNEIDALSLSLFLVVVNNIVFWPLCLLFTNVATISLEAIIIFIVAGILAPGLHAPLYFKGMKILGATINSAIVAINPLISSILAVFLFGENLTVENWIGIVCVVTGIMFIENYLSTAESAERNSRKALIIPIVASFILSFSFITRKKGLIVLNEPLVGITLGQSFSLLLLSMFSYASKRCLLSWREVRLFWKASLFMVVGGLLSFYALALERVSIVNTLVQTQPLFVFIISYVCLKEVEHVSKRLAMYILIIVVGAMLISVR